MGRGGGEEAGKEGRQGRQGMVEVEVGRLKDTSATKLPVFTDVCLRKVPGDTTPTSH